MTKSKQIDTFDRVIIRN